MGEWPGGYTFDDWLRTTKLLQELAYDAYYDQMSDEERADSLMMNLYAAIDEITEIGDECGWKPWASPRGWMNREAMIREAVDALHFIGNILTHTGCTGEELTMYYKAKQLTNLQRQIEGYDAVSDKCAYCHRELPADPYSCSAPGCVANGKFCNTEHHLLQQQRSTDE